MHNVIQSDKYSAQAAQTVCGRASSGLAPDEILTPRDYIRRKACVTQANNLVLYRSSDGDVSSLAHLVQTREKSEKFTCNCLLKLTSSNLTK